MVVSPASVVCRFGILVVLGVILTGDRVSFSFVWAYLNTFQEHADALS